MITRTPRTWASSINLSKSARLPYSVATTQKNGHVIAIIFTRRWVERQKPNAANPEGYDVAKFLTQPFEVADAVTTCIVEKSNIDLVKTGSLCQS